MFLEAAEELSAIRDFDDPCSEIYRHGEHVIEKEWRDETMRLRSYDDVEREEANEHYKNGSLPLWNNLKDLEDSEGYQVLDAVPDDMTVIGEYIKGLGFNIRYCSAQMFGMPGFAGGLKMAAPKGMAKMAYAPGAMKAKRTGVTPNDIVILAYAENRSIFVVDIKEDLMSVKTWTASPELEVTEENLTSDYALGVEGRMATMELISLGDLSLGDPDSLDKLKEIINHG